jgi:hypothetical protein
MVQLWVRIGTGQTEKANARKRYFSKWSTVERPINRTGNGCHSSRAVITDILVLPREYSILIRFQKKQAPKEYAW